jgi:hypothetical protein
MTWVRVEDVPRQSGLTDEELLAGVVLAMYELAVCQSLQMMHGKAEGFRKYVQYGGHIRFDEERRPIIELEAIQESAKHDRDSRGTSPEAHGQ